MQIIHFQQKPGDVQSNSHLFKWDTAGYQFDEISGSDDSIGVKCFPCCTNSHAAFDQVQGSFDVLTGLTTHVTHDHFPCESKCVNLNELTTSAKAFSTSGQHSFRYASLYLGKRVAKLLSSNRPWGLSSLVKEGSFHPSGTDTNSDSSTSKSEISQRKGDNITHCKINTPFAFVLTSHITNTTYPSISLHFSLLIYSTVHKKPNIKPFHSLGVTQSHANPCSSRAARYVNKPIN